MTPPKIRIEVANSSHNKYAQLICDTIEESAKVRGTGIAKRTPEYVISKLEKGNAVVALDGENFAGFCYIEAWGHEKYVANSGLIVHPNYRNLGLAKKIKKAIFDLSRKKFPDAKIFGITTGLAVMKINSDLGYRPVTFSELTDDPAFWKGCETCNNFDVLQRTQRKMCLCTGMLYDPNLKRKKVEEESFNQKLWTSIKNIKHKILKKEDKSIVTE